MVSERNTKVAGAALLRSLLDQCDVVALEKDPADVSFKVSLDVHFLNVVQDEIHVFVESDDDSLKTKVDDIVEPDLDADFLLEKAEDKVDGLHHHLLHLVTITRHIRAFKILKQPKHYSPLFKYH